MLRTLIFHIMFRENKKKGWHDGNQAFFTSYSGEYLLFIGNYEITLYDKFPHWNHDFINA